MLLLFIPPPERQWTVNCMLSLAEELNESKHKLWPQGFRITFLTMFLDISNRTIASLQAKACTTVFKHGRKCNTVTGSNRTGDGSGAACLADPPGPAQRRRRPLPLPANADSPMIGQLDDLWSQSYCALSWANACPLECGCMCLNNKRQPRPFNSIKSCTTGNGLSGCGQCAWVECMHVADWGLGVFMTIF